MQAKEIFTTLIKDHSSILNKLLYLYLDNDEDRNDMKQEIFFQAWRSFKSFKQESQFSTWFYRVGLNTILTSFRKKQHNFVQLDDETIVHEIHFQETNDRADFFQQLIFKLNLVDRMIISLHLDGYSHDEIIELVGIKKNHLNVKLHRIKTFLSKIYEEEFKS